MSLATTSEADSTADEPPRSGRRNPAPARGQGMAAWVGKRLVRAAITLWLVSIITFVLIPVAIVWMRPTDSQIYVLMAAFAAGTAFSALYGIIPGYTFRNPGFTYHPVALAYTCMLALSFVPFMLAHRQAKWRWWLVLPLAGAALAGIQTSGSRTSIVVLAALIVVVPVSSPLLGVNPTLTS